MSEEAAEVDALQYVTGRIVIEIGIAADGDSQVWVSVGGATNEDDWPPLVTALGMLDMARDSVYALYASGDENDD